MKKLELMKLHLYCGLFTSFYLIAFGVSSLIMNHKMNVDQKAVKHTWSGQVKINPDLNDTELAESVRNQLSLMGWVPPWEFNKDSTRFAFVVTQLAKDMDLQLDFSSGRVEVAERPKGFVAVLHGMHFFNGRIPNAPFFLKTWRVYQWLALLVLLLSMILGLWLWLKYSYKTWELYVFGGLFLLSCLLMMLI